MKSPIAGFCRQTAGNSIRDILKYSAPKVEAQAYACTCPTGVCELKFPIENITQSQIQSEVFNMSSEQNNNAVSIDALMPVIKGGKGEAIGIQKSIHAVLNMFVLVILGRSVHCSR